MATAHLPWHYTERPSAATLKFACLAAALWTICAVTVFGVLCVRENRSMRNLSSAVTAPQRVIQVLNPPVVARTAARPNYDRFTLSRTVRGLRQIGPVKLGVRRIGAGQRYCDLSIIVNGHGTTERRITANHPLWITLPGHSEPLELIVTRIAKRHVSGYLRPAANG
jgi:hypothetical protein